MKIIALTSKKKHLIWQNKHSGSVTASLVYFFFHNQPKYITAKSNDIIEIKLLMNHEITAWKVVVF